MISESPSKPGEPPAKESGELIQSIRIELDADELGAKVGSNLEYASFLELGTRRTSERPFLLPALERARTDIEHIIGQGARAIIDGSDFLRSDELARAGMASANFELQARVHFGESTAGRFDPTPDAHYPMIGSLLELLEPSKTAGSFVPSPR